MASSGVGTRVTGSDKIPRFAQMVVKALDAPVRDELQASAKRRVLL
jgi:hypothetical protein